MKNVFYSIENLHMNLNEHTMLFQKPNTDPEHQKMTQ